MLCKVATLICSRSCCSASVNLVFFASVAEAIEASRTLT